MLLKKISLRHFILLLSAFLFVGCASKSTLRDDVKQKKIADHILKAEKYIKKQRSDLAVKEYENILAVDSLYLTSYIFLGDYYLNEERYDMAERILQRAVQCGVRHPDVWMRIGEAQFHTKKYNEAIRNLELASGADSIRTRSQWLLAQLYYTIGNPAKSKLILDSLLRCTDLPNADEIRQFHRQLTLSPVQSVALNTAPIRRKEFAWLLVTILQPDTQTNSVAVPRDLSPVDPYYSYCLGALKSGYLELLPDNRFYPEYAMTRRNLVYYLFTWLPQMKKTVRYEPAALFQDVSPDDPHAEAVAAVYALGLVTPIRSGYFGLKEPVSGNEAAAALIKLKNLLDQSQ